MVKIKGKTDEIARIRVLLKRELRKKNIPFKKRESTQSLMNKVQGRKKKRS